MKSKSGFQRSFLIFHEEDRGYGIGRGPSGYIKIEIRDGRGRLYAFVKDLRNEQLYKLYLIKPGEPDSKVAYAGPVPVEKNKGELKWEFDPGNVGMADSGIDFFEAAVILAEEKNSETFQIVCPLAAYRDKKVSWRQSLKNAINVKISKQQDEIRINGDSYEALENKGKIDNNESAADAIEDSRPNMTDAEMQEASNAETKEISGPEAKVASNAEIINSDAVSFTQSRSMTGVSEKENVEPINNPECHSIHSETNSSNEGQEDGIDGDTMKEPGLQGSIGCTFSNNNFCGAEPYVTDNPCAASSLNNRNIEGKKTQKAAVDLRKLKQIFDQYFEKYDPFQNKRRDYDWWKVGSPVHLNNLLYQYDIKTPLLFNPAVMMSHFKYRHMIVGVYTDSSRNLEYIVCGIPAVYESDSRPFGDTCRWVQLESGRPRYGAFGYWLVYIDPNTGKFLNMR